MERLGTRLYKQPNETSKAKEYQSYFIDLFLLLCKVVFRSFIWDKLYLYHVIPGQFRRISYLRYWEFRLRWFSNPGLFASTWFRRHCRQISITRSVPRFLYSIKTLSSSYDSQRHSQHFSSNSGWAGKLWSHFFPDGYLWKLHLSLMFSNGMICGRFLHWVFLAIHEFLKTIVYSLP